MNSTTAQWALTRTIAGQRRGPRTDVVGLVGLAEVCSGAVRERASVVMAEPVWRGEGEVVFEELQLRPLSYQMPSSAPYGTWFAPISSWHDERVKQRGGQSLPWALLDHVDTL